MWFLNYLVFCHDSWNEKLILYTIGSNNHVTTNNASISHVIVLDMEIKYILKF